MIERKALVFNIQKYNTHDGHGVRTLVFFKGCPLRCAWCSNPEGQERRFEILFKKDLCTHCGACVPVCPVAVHAVSPRTGLHEVSRDVECLGCRRCEQACPASALAVAGETRTISELVEVVEQDRPFYDMSGGGVTLGGGEPLFQPEAAVSLLMACVQRGIDTAVETCGYARPEVLARAVAYTNLFLFDVKHMEPRRHQELTGVRNESILANLKALLEGRRNVRIRLPLLGGVNNGADNLERLAGFLSQFKSYKNFMGIDVLPYHRLGIHKFGQLGRDNPLPKDHSLTEADLERARVVFTARDIPAAVLKH